MGLVDTGVTDDFSMDKFHHNSQCPISDYQSQISGNKALNRVSSMVNVQTNKQYFDKSRNSIQKTQHHKTNN